MAKPKKLLSAKFAIGLLAASATGAHHSIIHCPKDGVVPAPGQRSAVGHVARGRKLPANGEGHGFASAMIAT